MHKSFSLFFIFAGVALFPGIGICYEYSVRHAFCSDYARNRTGFPSSSFQYDLQVAYNQCMQNANQLINKHETQKRRSAERARMMQLESEWRQKEIRRQEDAKKREEELRIRRQTNDMTNYFY